MLVPRRKNWDLFDDFFEDFPISESKCMKTDIKEHDDSYELIVDLPGFRERYEGEFKRSFYIGEDITEDEIKASFKNGILDINVPKVKEAPKSDKKYIEIDE